MAEFIKNKNESVISVAVKEKERKEEKIETEEKEKKENPHSSQKSTPKKEGFQINFTILLLSVFLIGGGVLVYFYVFKFIKEAPPAEVVVKEEIIPYNNEIALANVTNGSFGEELGKLPVSNGINIVNISDASGLSLQKVKDFFNFLGISLPPALDRTLKDQYAVGVISQDQEDSYFLVITVNDFGTAFSAMLDWEGNMDKDLSFLNTASSTETFSWKDLIVKNKDTRGLVDDKGESKIAYTFLDKNTILITNNLSAIGDISSAYVSRSVAR